MVTTQKQDKRRYRFVFSILSILTIVTLMQSAYIHYKLTKLEPTIVVGMIEIDDQGRGSFNEFIIPELVKHIGIEHPFYGKIYLNVNEQRVRPLTSDD